jgi:hypothetical protein
MTLWIALGFLSLAVELAFLVADRHPTRPQIEEVIRTSTPARALGIAVAVCALCILGGPTGLALMAASYRRS